MSLTVWKAISATLSWFFDREYSVFEVILLMGLVQSTSNFWMILAFGLLIVMVAGLMRGISEALADHLKD